MSERKKGRLIVVLLGVICVLAAVLILVLTLKATRWTAIIREVSVQADAGDAQNRKSLRETVEVTYVDANGKEQTASGIRVKRKSGQSLPQAGDTIQITGRWFKREYRPGTPVAAALVLLAAGLCLIVGGIRFGRRRKQPAEPKTKTEQPAKTESKAKT